jgi:hypothetical protein
MANTPLVPPETVVVGGDVTIVVDAAAVVDVAVVGGVTAGVDVAVVDVTIAVVDDEVVGATEVDGAPLVVGSGTLVVVGSAGSLVVT